MIWFEMWQMSMVMLASQKPKKEPVPNNSLQRVGQLDRNRQKKQLGMFFGAHQLKGWISRNGARFMQR